MQRFIRTAAVIAAMALFLSACGADDTVDSATSAAGTSDPATSAATDGDGSTEGDQTTDSATSGSCELPEGTDDRGTAEVSGSEVEIIAGDLFFDPTCLTGLEPGTVTVTIVNEGQSLHNIKVEDQGIDVDIAAGETVTVDLELTAGSNPYVCKYHETAGMVGDLVAG